MKNFFKKNKKAFTLIEVMVAITILLLSIVGPMQIAAKSLFAAFYARDEITAYYLAQEGIEYLRNKRDMYFGDNTSGWPPEFSMCANDPDAESPGCKLDLYQLSIGSRVDPISACGNSGSSNPCGYLNYNSDTGLYSYESTGDLDVSQSKFSRLITVTTPYNGSNDEALVTATISWSGGQLYSGTRTFTLSEVLYDWQIY